MKRPTMPGYLSILFGGHYDSSTFQPGSLTFELALEAPHIYPTLFSVEVCWEYLLMLTSNRLPKANCPFFCCTEYKFSSYSQISS